VKTLFKHTGIVLATLAALFLLIMSGFFAGEPTKRRAEHMISSEILRSGVHDWFEIQNMRLKDAPVDNAYHHSFQVRYDLVLRHDAREITTTPALLGDAQLLSRQVYQRELQRLFKPGAEAGDAVTLKAIATFRDRAQRRFINNDRAWELVALQSTE
jgi:hypothetical protein